MVVFRTDIEKALDELVSNEEGMKFQGLAIILAKQKWPELIACERKKDLGLDAYAGSSLSGDRVGKGLVCSLTSTLNKIKSDAAKVKNNFDEIQRLIFVTPHKVSNQIQKNWAAEIRTEFGFDLTVISREDIILSLMLPENAQLNRTFLGIPVTIQESIPGLAERAREAITEMVSGWLSHPLLAGKPLISLRAVKLNEFGADTEAILDFKELGDSLIQGRRLVLEAPAGRGKTTTLIQLAQSGISGGLTFFIDLPAWASTM